jgi:hypothetical protein
MRTVFIGDVHGCREELAELMREAFMGTPGKDRVIFVGDLVDKGPDSLGVLRDVQRMMRTFPGSAVVIGNHEEKALRFKKSGKLDQLKDQSWVHEATEADWSFIESMPLTWYDPETHIRVIHGGIFPALTEKHPDVWEKIEARGANWHKGGGKVMNRARRMLRVRHVGGPQRPAEAKDGPGSMLALGANVEGDPFWADVYDGRKPSRGGLVIYGHSPWLDGEVRESKWALGIDTACVFGGKLTAAIFERGLPQGYVQVDAREKYAEPYEEED